ncbi:MAG: hypothetical protein M1296_03450 [Chloroflexi bacterium]|nr:hypothetical protein [Chloroflexota bacterium]
MGGSQRGRKVAFRPREFRLEEAGAGQRGSGPTRAEELLNGQKADFTNLEWPVYSEYLIRFGTLHVADGSTKLASYLPIREPQIAMAFAKLSDASDDAILDYARKWGKLGSDRLVERKVRSTYALEVELEDEGDSVEWIRRHATCVIRQCHIPGEGGELAL